MAARRLSCSPPSRSSHSLDSSRPEQVRVRLLGECQKVRRVAPAQLVALARLLEPLGRILADRLQHPEAFARVAEEALVDERLERVQVGLRDLLSGLERAAAAEDRESREQVSFPVVEQVVAPGDRRAQRPLAGIGIAAALEQVEALRQALEDLSGREHARPRRGQLHRERQVVQPAAQLGHVVAPTHL